MLPQLRVLFVAVALVMTAGTGSGVGAAGQAAPPVETPHQEAAPASMYESHGRRDPFVSLAARGRDVRTTSSRPPGLAGLLVGEVTVRGVVHDRTGFIAMVQGPDRKTFIVRAGEQLMDGTIKTIDADGIVFGQDVADPLATVKQKEVRKHVRPVDGGRP